MTDSHSGLFSQIVCDMMSTASNMISSSISPASSFNSPEK